MDMTKQQNDALEAIAEWYGRQQEWTSEPFRLFGPAGTGKTTLAKQVAGTLGIHDVMFGAYTGKAANVLRSKGCQPAGTLHSLIYRPVASEETRRKLERAREELQMLLGAKDVVGTDYMIVMKQEEIARLEQESTQIGWEWNPDSELADASLLILDEVSMVDRKLADDLERFGVPILVLGDPEQLEPVGGEGYYTNAAPDYMLTEIHRQALDSPVLELATRVRQSSDQRLGLTAADFTDHSLELAMEHDQILCWKNATRWMAVNKIRAAMACPPDRPVPGDRIMCLTNNRGLGIFNGQQFYVLESREELSGEFNMLVRDDAGQERRLKSHPHGFQGEAQEKDAKQKWVGGRGKVGLFTFAQAITVHKAQGSEWGTVYVVNETPGMISMTASRKGMEEAIRQARRWLYTSVTRASENITITRPRGH